MAANVLTEAGFDPAALNATTADTHSSQNGSPASHRQDGQGADGGVGNQYGGAGSTAGPAWRMALPLPTKSPAPMTPPIAIMDICRLPSAPRSGVEPWV
ncbi:hypothetical protein ACWDCB_19890 [Streptomyces sp. NPDC001178]